jgi:ATP phosphoribosyltransferase
LLNRLIVQDLDWTVPGVRFALMSLPEKAEAVQRKLEGGSPVLIGTTYPETVGAIALSKQVNLQIEAVYGGQIEKLPRLLPRLDGVIDLIDTGASKDAQGLVVVRDDLKSVGLCGMWAGSAYD